MLMLLRQPRASIEDGRFLLGRQRLFLWFIMESGAVLVVFAGDDFQAVFSLVLVGIACGSWPGLAPAGDLPFCPANKGGEKSAPHPAG